MKFVAPEGEDGVGEAFEGVQAVGHLLRGRDEPALDHFPVVGFEGQQEFPAVEAGFFDVVGVLGEVSQFVENDVFGVPLAIAVGAPLGEVLRLLPLCDKLSATFQK